MELLNKYCTDIRILPSQVDFQCKLGYYETFKLFMDMANEHASILGVGQSALMDKGLFWLTVKTRFRFIRRPLMGQKVQVQTWPVKPLSLRTDRCYRLCDENGVLVEGRTEWAVMDMKALRLANVSTIFPQDLVFNEESFSVTDFPRITNLDESCTERGTYKVTSSDIDMGMHMNNCAYVRALMGFFSTAEQTDMDIKDMTVIFKASAHENDLLTMRERRDGDELDCGLFMADSKPSILAKIVC